MPDGSPGFVERHVPNAAVLADAGKALQARMAADGVRMVRLAWSDQHGIAKGKTVRAEDVPTYLADGKDFQVLSVFDTTNHPILYPFTPGGLPGVPEVAGLPDSVLVPDPSTYRMLPWLPGTGWVLCDNYFRSGRADPLCSRLLLKRQIERLHAEDRELIVGLELEFYILRLQDQKLSPEHSGNPPAPPEVTYISHGYQYLTELRADEVEPITSVLEGVIRALGLPLRSLEVEWGPGQCELTFAPLPASDAADAVLLLRTAIKQVCKRHGYHASFMALPKLPNALASGWHLHQSVIRRSDGANLFRPRTADEPLTPLGMAWVAGLIANAAGSMLLTTPTVNGYKRHRPDSLAPIAACWGVENRAAMLRVIGDAHDANTRIENRVGDPNANPYFFIAAQIAGGLDGVARGADPGPAVVAAYAPDIVRLPRSLMAAIEAFRASAALRDAFGVTFCDYILQLKSFEADRFLSAVTDWEHQEYFEIY